jgi:hypothetical protein
MDEETFRKTLFNLLIDLFLDSPERRRRENEERDAVCLPSDAEKARVHSTEKSSQAPHTRGMKRERSKIVEADDEIELEALFSFLYGD